MSSGSCCSAAEKSISPGRNSTTRVRRRIELRLIRLASQPRHVVAHLARVVDETLLAHVFIVGLAASRYAKSGVFASTTMFRPPGSRTTTSGRCLPLPRHARLLDEVAMLDHPGHFDDATQLQLAPAPARRRLTQRLHEIQRLAPQIALAFIERAHLGREA